MTELDVETLKQTVGGLRWILQITEERGLPKVSVEVDELRTILAALEDRDRLRDEILRWSSADKVTPAKRSAWAKTVRGWGYPAIADAMDSEWAALEGRDG